jgi:hypothetical protein
MINKDDKMLWELYLKESPWSFPELPNDFDSKMETTNIRDIEKLNCVGTFEEFKIYETVVGDKIELYFTTSNELAAFYSYIVRNKQPIKTKLVWNSKKHIGTLRRVFGDYIIPKFKIVESDDMMSDSAFKMWQKMIGFYPQYKFFAKVGDNLIPLKHPYDVFTYKEKLTDRDSPFIVEYGEK